jgi:hypothetical protein
MLAGPPRTNAWATLRFKARWHQRAIAARRVGIADFNF